MKNISLSFTLHQPVALKRYRFFDIGYDDYYYDDYANERRIRILADECYLPNNQKLLELITKYKDRIKAAFCLSGTIIDLFTLYAPEVIKSFQQLASTGNVEFLAETYSHSLASLENIHEFERQAEFHARQMSKIFGKRPEVFKYTEFIFSGTIGRALAGEGFKFLLAEEEDSFPGWKGPDHVYCCSVNRNLKILFKNTFLSNKAALFLSDEGPEDNQLQHESFVSLLNNMPDEGNIINICIDYEIIKNARIRTNKGGLNHFETFIKNIAESEKLNLKMPSELCKETAHVCEITIPDSFIGSEKSERFEKLMGNELQKEALDRLYDIRYRINHEKDHLLWKDWQYLQSSDHFYYMSSIFFTDGHSDHHHNPYDNPYEAFINYMNVLSDFTRRLYNMPAREMEYLQQSVKTVKKLPLHSERLA